MLFGKRFAKAHEYQDSVMMKSFHHVLASVFYEKGDYKKAKQHLDFAFVIQIP